MPSERNIRIGNVSGATGDAPHAMARMVREGDVDVITGDWLSEMNIAWNAIAKAENPDLGYEIGFYDQLGECREEVAARKIKILDDWDSELTPLCAAAYIGCWGIVEALKSGADIVICGRVTDASPVIGAVAWWYGWEADQFDILAVDLAFPIVEILADGTCYISKPETMNGTVNKFNITAQLLYELQGELYLNPDVVANLANIQIESTGQKNRVYVRGVTGLPPPPTTKVTIAAPGGFQAETTYYLNGLDVHAKAKMMQQQLANLFGGSDLSKFSSEVYGTEAIDPSSQQEGTTMLRVFVQARRKEDLAPAKFKTPIYSLRMQSYPGYHMNLDFRTMEPKPFMEIFPSLTPQLMIDHRVRISMQRPSYETTSPHDLSSFGETVRAPLGSIVHARSGDKANNPNVGFFVRNADEYAWLQSILTVKEMKKSLGKDYGGRESSA
ncbi:hypothetical protein B0A48_08810 [Cryoendolithus antarcticus]|uniref:Uncharacterized protein n=1 Tax=Cryoendolithus antarcticus TaxID=1507870 RepID=A0A1V8T4Y1_9PEZI|nr:hypothetical protein B0A48_08810 [Cryoendolithus antarcticus]